ncbi:MAG TPA: hypothetical protein VGM33_15845 [Baekduia sp.]
MGVLALKLLLAPSFVVGASLIARRLGPRIGGLVGGLPVVAGPILLVLALVHGRGFGADAARASLLGLVSLTACVVTYGRLCATRPWTVALPLGWAAFLATTAVASLLDVSSGVALALALAAFVAGWAALPAAPPPAATTTKSPPPSWDLPVRAGCAAAMVLALTGVAAGLGPELSGLLAPFPIITSVLAAFTHAQRGPADTVRLLRGMLVGFVAFALFCFVAAAVLPSTTVLVAFAAASAVAVLTQTAMLGGEVVRSRA